MEHFANPEKPLKELVRVLKPSGTVLIAVPNKFNLWSLGKMSIDLLSRLHMSKPWKYGYEKSYTKYGLRNLLNSIGLRQQMSLDAEFLRAYILQRFFHFENQSFC